MNSKIKRLIVGLVVVSALLVYPLVLQDVLVTTIESF